MPLDIQSLNIGIELECRPGGVVKDLVLLGRIIYCTLNLSAFLNSSPFLPPFPIRIAWSFVLWKKWALKSKRKLISDLGILLSTTLSTILSWPTGEELFTCNTYKSDQKCPNSVHTYHSHEQLCCVTFFSNFWDIFVADGINSVGDYNSPLGGCRLCLFVFVPTFFQVSRLDNF